MSRKLLLAVTLLLAGCDHDFQSYQPRSNAQLAQDCGVPANEIKRAKSLARSKEPYQAVQAGKCTFTKSDGRDTIMISSVSHNESNSR